ncbi:MAG: glycosyltransferase family 2 protein [Candidatus Hydrogenedentes bacterium]|nr:glycosyltransferase family 2 protein [Candidatus Hydrogenedentota bacterium]
MDVSIIIPARNSADWLCALLMSIADARRGGHTVEIVVVDDASTDGTVSAIRERFPEVRVLETGQPSGPALARNIGARDATGELLLFLDADGEVDAGWLEAMAAAHDGRTILLGNVVDYHVPRAQSVPRRATFLGKSLHCRPERANTGPSCNLGVPRAVFESLGGFDEELTYYFEDSDLCIRARRAGVPFRFVEGAVFRHHGTEKKSGDAIRLQERHSTYAMLKIYEDEWFQIAAFSVLNAGWMIARYAWWTLRGRREDAARLARGWWEATMNFLGPRI